MGKKVGVGCLVVLVIAILLAIVGGMAATGTESSESSPRTNGSQVTAPATPAAPAPTATLPPRYPQERVPSLPAPTATPPPAAPAPTAPPPPAAAAPPAPPPPAAQPVALSGRGTSTTAVDLTDGLFTVDINVTGNTDDGRPTNIVVKIESVQGGQELLLNEVAASWSGSVTVRVGSRSLGLGPGRSIISVDAAPGATWEISITAAAGSSTVQVAPPPAAQPVALSGRGTSTAAVDLTDGLFTVDINVTGNTDDGRPTHIAARIESVQGGRKLLLNEVAASWSGSVTVRVGSRSLDLEPGRSIISVDAAPGATWEMSIQPQ